MNLNIKGKYSFKIPIVSMFLNTEMIIKGENLITALGESFFLHRCIGEEFKTMEYIVLGNGVNAPNKKDITLGNETIRQNTIKTVDLNAKQLILTSMFSVEELIGTSEIGVVTLENNGEDGVLISHDTFKETVLSEDFLYSVVGQVQVEYIFQFSTSQIKTGWTKSTSYSNSYYVYEPNSVKSVLDNTNHYGLVKTNSATEMNNTKNSYYHNVTGNNNIYIHLYHEDGEVAPNPNEYEIIIENN